MKVATVRSSTALRPQALSGWAGDFVGFAAKLDILDDVGRRQKLRPNAVQAAFEVVRTGRDIVLKPRQIGFTTWELARDVWVFLTRPGARVVVVCLTEEDHRQVEEIAGKLRVMFEGLRDSGIHIEVQNESTRTWIYGDASLRIVECGGSEKTAGRIGRGGTVHRLHITELAFFEFAQTTLTAIMPCVPAAALGTEIVIESTANGAAGAFFERYKAAKAGRGEFRPHFVRWTDHPKYQTALGPNESIFPQTDRERELLRDGASAAQLKWYRLKVDDAGQNKVDQEFPSNEETCWLIAGRIFFDKEALNRALSQCRDPLHVEKAGSLRIWKEPEAGRRYVIVGDPSEGVGGDPSGACVYARETGEHVATFRGQIQPWDFGGVLAELGHRWNGATVVVERNNHGHAVLDSLRKGEMRVGDDGAASVVRKPYPHIFLGLDGKPGWLTTHITRPAALDALEPAVRTGAWSTPDREVIGEMLTFIIAKDGKAQATNGAHDELVIVPAIAWDVLRKPIRKAAPPTPPPVGLTNFDTAALG